MLSFLTYFPDTCFIDTSVIASDWKGSWTFVLVSVSRLSNWFVFLYDIITDSRLCSFVLQPTLEYSTLLTMVSLRFLLCGSRVLDLGHRNGGCDLVTSVSYLGYQ